METPSQKHQETIRAHIADGETAIDACTTEQETYLVTARRLLVLTHSDRGNETTTVESTFFDAIGGIEIHHRRSSGPDELSLVFGILALIVGLLSLALLGRVDGGEAAIIVLFGLGGAVIGILAILDAYDTDEGSVSVDLLTTEGDSVRNFTLHEDYLEFAETISKTAADTHPSRVRKKRTVSG
ncbi:hypothetical protein [Natrononativus amylolyticus]|uniref:hypothetical protein n=1 Tax=Natrononativus amylolyticus TaxID=2963434 RepID=UPI0020CC1210|nr:hypothetical protein [Natrononativus amylolyticus]